MKKLLSLLLTLCLLVLSVSAAFAAEDEKVFSNAADVLGYVIVDDFYTTPVRVVPAKLTVNGATLDVWFIALLGLKSIAGQVNSATGGGDHVYARFVKQVAEEVIPEGSSVIIAGHSLGGMTAQLLRADGGFTEKYELINVLCGGAPYIYTKGGEGTINRLADVFDVIPYIVNFTPTNFIRLIRATQYKNGGYLLNPYGAHNLSYGRADVWGGFDALGVKGGDAVISFSEAQVQSFGDAA